MKLMSGPGVLACLMLCASPVGAAGPSSTALSNPNAKAPPTPVPLVCADYRIHAKYLSQRFGEHPVFTGRAAPGVEMRIMANTTTGSWTMLFVRQDGTSCVRGVGRDGRHEVGL